MHRELDRQFRHRAWHRLARRPSSGTGNFNAVTLQAIGQGGADEIAPRHQAVRRSPVQSFRKGLGRLHLHQIIERYAFVLHGFTIGFDGGIASKMPHENNLA
jgi:hypothetical protein